jgi:hypothetical protein
MREQSCSYGRLLEGRKGGLGALRRDIVDGRMLW